jgi:hypothetical protein
MGPRAEHALHESEPHLIRDDNPLGLARRENKLAALALLSGDLV